MTTAAPHLSWPSAARSVDDVTAVLMASANHREPSSNPAAILSQLEHGLQCADLLQMTHPDDEELQVAGLLHDIGHTLAPGAVEAHGRIGAAWVGGLLGERVASLIELHVPAKRYLVTVDPDYRDRLSAASVQTLRQQGDVLTVDEVAAFVASPHHRSAITLRRADEGAKVAGIDAGRVVDWLPALHRLAAR